MLDLRKCRELLGPDAPSDDTELQELVDALYALADALLEDQAFQYEVAERIAIKREKSFLQ